MPYGHKTEDQTGKNVKNYVGLEIKTKQGREKTLETLAEMRHSKEIKLKNCKEMENEQNGKREHWNLLRE